MDGTSRRALKVARVAGLFLMPVSERAVVRIRAGVLEVGADACADLVATVSCRHMVERGRGVDDEEMVRLLVGAYGFVYVPAPWTTPISTTMRVVKAC